MPKGTQRSNREKKKPKQPVIAALCPQTGQVRARVIPNVTAATLKSAVNDLVDKSATLHTDELMQYRTIGREYAGHEAIRHKSKQYVRADGMTTNTVESFFALLKRGIVGTYHHVSEAHLQRYVNEFDFRFSNRKSLGVNDFERAVKTVVSTLEFCAPHAVCPQCSYWGQSCETCRGLGYLTKPMWKALQKELTHGKPKKR